MIESYINGLKLTLNNKKMVTIIYLITLFLGLTIALPFHSFVDYYLSGSLLINDLLSDFDYTAYMDLIKKHPEISSLIPQIIRWFGIGFLFISIFLTGGILGTFIIDSGKLTLKSFAQYCGKYFGKFFRVTLYTVIFQLIFLIIFAIPYSIIIKSLSKTVQSESTLFYVSLIWLIAYLFIFSFFIVVSDYTKINLATNDQKKVFITLLKTIKTVLTNFGSYILYLLTLIFPILLTLLYFFLDANIGMTSGITILVMFLIQQIFVWSRMFGKVWVLASATKYFDSRINNRVKTNEDITERDVLNNLSTQES